MQKLKYLLIFCVSFYALGVKCQTDAGVKIMPKQGELYENAKKLNNPYILPVGAKKLGEKGFLLPYPIGIMLNGYMAEQDVMISDLQVGLSDANGKELIPMIPLDDVIEFSEVTASVKNFNLRTDLWVLPFLDVYGIFGKAWVETGVGIGSIMGSPVNIQTQANFDGYVYGVGAMLTGGVRSIFFSLDFNKVWTHFDELKNDNTAMTLSPRVGYVFHFDNLPERNVSVWTGASRVFLSNTTVGSINLSDIAPDFGKNYPGSDWYQKLPDRAQDLVDKVVENHEGDVINYTLNKRPVHNWTMILGAQYQADRHWQFRVESNFLGGRRSGLISANYRFGIK